MARSQFWILLWKNLLQRWRQPVILIFEIFWPLALLAVLLIIRHASPPEFHSTCRYRQRLLPSSGVVPFLQSFICNLQNECELGNEPRSGTSSPTSSSKYTTYDSSKVSDLFVDINKWAGGEKGARALKVLPKGLKILYAVNNELSRPEVQLVLNSELRVGSFLMNPEQFIKIVSEDNKYMSRKSLEKLLNSTLSVTELYGLSEITSVKTLLCDPARMAHILVLPDSLTKSPDTLKKATENRQVIAMISEELCRLSDDEMIHLATLVQEQLNITALLRKASTFAMAVNEVETAKMLSNFAEMVSVVSVVPGLDGAGNTLNKSMTVAQWLADTKPLWSTASDEKRRGAIQKLDKVLKEVEPFVHQLAGSANIPSWTGFRQSMATMAGFFKLFDMLMTTPGDIDGANFGNFFTKDAAFDEKVSESLMPYGLGHPDNVTAILSSRLRFDKFAAVLARIENGTAAKRLLCEYPGLMQLFRFPDWFVPNHQMQVQMIVCTLPNNHFQLEFLRKINTNKVVDEYVKVSKRSIRSLPDGSFASVDQGIRRATRELRDIARSVDDLLDVYEQVQPAQLYQSLMGVVRGEVAENIDPLLLTGATVFQFFLEKLPDMWGLLKGPIAMTDVALEFIEHILYTPSLIDDYAAYRLMSSPEGRSVGQLVISEGAQSLSAFLENLRKDNSFQLVYQHPVALAEYACDKNYLRKALNMDTNRHSLSQIMDEICTEQFKLLLLRLRRDAVTDLQFGRISSAASELARATKTYPLLEPVVESRANISSVLTRLSRIIGYSEHPLFNEEKLDSIVDSFRYDTPGDRRVAWEGWSGLKKLMKKRWTIEQFVRSSDWLGPLLEQLPNWEQLRPGFELTRLVSGRMNDILWFSNTLFHYSATMAQAAIGRFTNYNDYLKAVGAPLDNVQLKLSIGTSRYLSKMLHYVVKYSPAIVKGTLEAAVDPSKLLQVSLALWRDPSSLCAGRLLEDIFSNLDQGVPTDELRRFICSDRSMGFVEELREIFDWTNFTRKIDEIMNQPSTIVFKDDGTPEHIPFEWTSLTDSALQMFESGQVLLSAGTRWADFVRNAATGKEKITVSADFFKLMKPNIEFDKLFTTDTLVRTVPFFMQLLDVGSPPHAQQMFRRSSQLLSETISGALSGKQQQPSLFPQLMGGANKMSPTYYTGTAKVNAEMQPQSFAAPISPFFANPSLFGNMMNQQQRRRRRSAADNSSSAFDDSDLAFNGYVPSMNDVYLEMDRFIFNFPRAISSLAAGDDCGFGKAIAESLEIVVPKELVSHKELRERLMDILCHVEWLSFAQALESDEKFGPIAKSIVEIASYGRYIKGEIPFDSALLQSWLTPITTNYTQTIELVNRFIEMTLPPSEVQFEENLTSSLKTAKKRRKNFDLASFERSYAELAQMLELDLDDPRLAAQIFYYGALRDVYRDLVDARLWELPPGTFKRVLLENFPVDNEQRYRRQAEITENVVLGGRGRMPSFGLGDITKLAKAASALGEMFKVSQAASKAGNDLIPPNAMWARAKNENGTTLPLHQNLNLKSLAETFYNSQKIGDVAGILNAADKLEPVLRDKEFVSKLGKMTKLSSSITDQLGTVVNTMSSGNMPPSNDTTSMVSATEYVGNDLTEDMFPPSEPFFPQEFTTESTTLETTLSPSRGCSSCSSSGNNNNGGGGGGLLGGLGGLGGLAGLAGGFLGGSGGGGGDAIAGLLTTACGMPALRQMAARILPAGLAPALDWVCVMQELHPDEMKRLLTTALSVLQAPPNPPNDGAQNMFTGATGGIIDGLFSLLNVPKPPSELEPFLGPSPSMGNTPDPSSLLGPFKVLVDLMTDVAYNHPGFLCDAVLAPFVNVPSFANTRLYLNWVQSTAKLLADLFSQSKTIPDFICDVIRADFEHVYERIRNGTAIVDVIQRMSQLQAGNTTMLFSCDSLIHSVQAVVETSLYYSSKKPSWPKIVSQCSDDNRPPSANAVLHTIPPILEEVDSLFRILSSMRRRTATKSLRALTSLFSDVEPALDTLDMNSLKPEQSFKIFVSDLFSDKYQTEKLLLSTLQLDPIVVKWLLNSAVVDFEQIHSFNLTRPMVQYVLCNSTRLASYLASSPQAGYYCRDISRQACSSPETLEAVFKHITESFSFTKLLEKLSWYTNLMNVDWLSDVLRHGATAAELADQLVPLQFLSNGLTLKGLFHALPQLEDFIAKGGPQKLAAELRSMALDLEPMRSLFPALDSVLNRLETVARGIESMRYFTALKRHKVVFAEIVPDQRGFRERLFEAGYNKSVITTILNSPINVIKAITMHQTEFEQMLCDPLRLMGLVNTAEWPVDPATFVYAICAPKNRPSTIEPEGHDEMDDVTMPPMKRLSPFNDDLLHASAPMQLAQQAPISMTLTKNNGGPASAQAAALNHALHAPRHQVDQVFVKPHLRHRRDVSTQTLDAIKNKIGGVVRDVVQFGVASFLSKYSISHTDLLELGGLLAVENVRDVKAGFEQFMAQLPDSFRKWASDVSERSLSGTELLQSASEMVCGRSLSFSILPEQDAQAVQENLQAQRASSGANDDKKSDLDDDDISNIFNASFDCDQLYSLIRRQPIGSLMWGVLKPLLYGKILYSPSSSEADLVMLRVRALFNEVRSLRDLSTAWAEGTAGLRAVYNSTDNLASLNSALNNPFISVALFNRYGLSGAEFAQNLDVVRTVADKHLDTVSLVANVLSRYTQCIAVDRFESYATEAELERRANELNLNKSILAAIVFENLDGNRTTDEGKPLPGHSIGSLFFPTHLRYKIRMDLDTVMPTDKLKEKMWQPGSDLLIFDSDTRYLRGFMQIQDTIDRAFISITKSVLKANISGGGSYASVRAALTQTYDAAAELRDSLMVTLRQFPHGCFQEDKLAVASAYFMPVLVTMGWLFIFASIVRNLVREREAGLIETLRVMGLDSRSYFCSWFANVFIGQLATVGVFLITFKVGNIFRLADPSILFLYFEVFSLSSIAFAFFMSSFFSNTNLAGLVSVLVFLSSYLPFVFSFTLDVNFPMWAKLVSCVLSTTAFSHGCLIFTRFELQGVGINWENINTNPVAGEPLTFVMVIVVMLFDSLLYLILGAYIQRIRPGRFGQPRPWHFPITDCFRTSRRRASPRQPSQLRNEKSNVFEEPEVQAVGEGNMTMGTNRRPTVGVALRHLTKEFSGGRLAVRGLTMDIYEGRITALLGHNGAGKTTTINMLTGIYNPTVGNAYVYGRDASACGDANTRRLQIGFCPQHDVLFEYMTVREHLRLFGHIKAGWSGEELAREVERMLSAIDLVKHADVRVCYLSGGQRRRLSVGIAFLGGSRVVILDEPTSGVDPHARRAIWHVISKFREGRTILLSTHQLDEAEVMSNRIAIMHQGRLLCYGSAMFLKSRLGTGYKLTLSHADRKRCTAQQRARESDVKDAYTLQWIQRYVPEARLSESYGNEVTFTLPSSNSCGMSSLLSQLDHNLTNLGFTTYGISQCTLEDLFLKVCAAADAGDPINPEHMRYASYLPHDDDYLETSDVVSIDSAVNMAGLKAMVAKPYTTPNGLPLPKVSAPKPLATFSSKNKVTGMRLLGFQISALVEKRLRHHWRSSATYVSQLLLPCLLVALAMSVSMLRPRVKPQPSLELYPALYANPDTDVFYRPPSFDRPGDLSNPLSQLHTAILTDPVGLGPICASKRRPASSLLRSAASSPLKSAGFNRQGTEPCTVSEPSIMNVLAMNRTAGLYNIFAEAEAPYHLDPATDEDCPSGTAEVNVPHWRLNSSELLWLLPPADNGADVDIDDYLLATEKNFIDKRYGGFSLAKARDGRARATVWYNTKAYHALPAFYNALNNALLRAGVASSGAPGFSTGSYGITVSSHPLLPTSAQLSGDTLAEGFTDMSVAMIILCGVSFVPASLVVYASRERLTRQKHMQHIYGVSYMTYWMVAFCWDLASYFLSVSLIAGLMRIFALDVFVARQNLPAAVSLLLLYGWATIPLMYLLSRRFTDLSVTYLVMFSVNIFIGINTTAAVYLLQFFSWIPTARIAYTVLQYAFLPFFPQYALGAGLFKLTRNHLMTSIVNRFGVPDENSSAYISPFSFSMLAWHYIAMTAQGIIFFIINLILDHNWAPRQMDPPTRRCRRSPLEPADGEDDDVVNEKRRVVEASGPSAASSAAKMAAGRSWLLTLYRLTKEFATGSRKIRAVDELCVAVGQGECFGLLGTNGAGKTTTFRMLSGETIPTYGSARLAGGRFDVAKAIGSSMRVRIGYCPQTDAVDELLTAAEHIQIYGRIRGIPARDIDLVTLNLLRQLALEPFASRAAMTYSGGTRRKLAVALALLDDPDVVLLDEPTTSMDPRTRRLVWSVVLDTIRAGRSVVLTSHSMEECDALCTRLAIMVNGRLRCIGNPQHIKNKYGSGYTVMVRCKGADNVAPTLAYMRHNLGSQVALVDRNLETLELRVSPHYADQTVSRQLSALILAGGGGAQLESGGQRQPCRLGTVFELLERAKNQLHILNDYSVSQTTLDQIFVNFARHQSDADQKKSRTSKNSKSSAKKSANASNKKHPYAGIWSTESCESSPWSSAERVPRRRHSKQSGKHRRSSSTSGADEFKYSANPLQLDSHSTTSSSTGGAGSPHLHHTLNSQNRYMVDPMRMPSLPPPDVVPHATTLQRNQSHTTSTYNRNPRH